MFPGAVSDSASSSATNASGTLGGLNCVSATPTERESGDEHSLERNFHPAQCLFCNKDSADLEENLSHMFKIHGLFIPEKDRLVVDVETLVAYFHLVIFGYFECLHCGSQKYSAEAVQQHMVAKGHCKFDVYEPNSEFRDFYDFGDGQSSDESDDTQGSTDGTTLAKKTDLDQAKRLTRPQFIDPDGMTMHLPSGKLLSHRSSPRSSTRPPKSHIEEHNATIERAGPGNDMQSTQPAADVVLSDVTGVNSTTLTRAERRDATFVTKQLTRLRVADRRSLLHLSTAQQRAVLAVKQKQLDKSRRDERVMRSRVESLGNKTLMKHFVPDTPGRSNG